MLGASFFFNRNEGDHSNAQKFFSTITVQLTAHFREMVSAVRLTRGLHRKRLDRNSEILSTSPLRTYAGKDPLFW